MDIKKLKKNSFISFLLTLLLVMPKLSNAQTPAPVCIGEGCDGSFDPSSPLVITGLARLFLPFTGVVLLSLAIFFLVRSLSEKEKDKIIKMRDKAIIFFIFLGVVIILYILIPFLFNYSF